MAQMLEAYGFHQEWIHWIMNITSMAFFSILLNSALTKTFKPSGSIRQGDPLSPFLFILMVEHLIRIIKDKIVNRELMGLKLHME